MRILEVLAALIALNLLSHPLLAQSITPENSSSILLIGGSSVACNPGYQRIGNSCEKIDLPDNAVYFGLGNQWRCTRGYRKSDNKCLKILVPLNGKLNIVGNDWVCNEGFTASGFSCFPNQNGN